MNRATPALLLLFGLFSAVSCTHSIHQVAVSDYSPFAPYAEGKLVQASSEQTVIMGFTDSTAYVSRAATKLMEQCPEGEIRGITTQYSTSHGFFHWKNKIFMQGLCVKG